MFIIRKYHETNKKEREMKGEEKAHVVYLPMQ
jgi:hypothetical protein